MNTNICYIFGAGEHFSLPPALLAGGYVIAADGGYCYLEKYGIIPDLAIGDFDSCKASPHAKKTIVLPREKDTTDMVEAISAGFLNGLRIFHIYGGTGGRIDHTIANIQCIADLARKGAHGFLFDRTNVITAINNGEISFGKSATGYISVFAHSDIARGVYEKGLKYPLQDAILYNTDPIGVSNEFIGMPSSIYVGDGTLTVVFSIGSLGCLGL